MKSNKESEKSTSRRGFFQDVTAATAGLAMATALTQLGVTNAAAAQGGKEQGAGADRPSSPFFRDPPPWPEGTTGNKYDHLFSTKLRENSITDVVAGPQAYFRGESDLPGAKINMGWQMFTKPYRLELESHHHDTDEYLFFLGAELPDLVGSFDGEIEYFLGKEYEKHIITQATVLYIPAGLEHNPCDIKRLSKPMMFSALHMAPYFNGVYQKQGYMELRGMKKME